jgi:putative ABC transport system permease protein
METLWQDIRYAVRMLGKSPAFTLIAVLTLALGIGANTAIFSVLDAVLIKSLPYRDPSRIAMVWGDERDRGNQRSQVSATDVADWRTQNHVFEDVTTVSGWTPVLTGNGEPERVPAVIVGDGFFNVMRARPLLGRTFLPEEQIDGKDQVTILTYGLWQRRFGGDAKIIGQFILLNARPHQVIGVMSPEFQSLPFRILDGPAAELYRPVGENYEDNERSSRHLRAIARLKPGVTLDQAQADMEVIVRRLEREHPRTNTNYGVRLVTLREDTVGSLRPALLLLFGAVGLVLLIACANVANLLLARSTTRQKEIAIRAALGAGRSRLVRQFLTESVLVGLAGGILGLLLATWSVSLILALGAKVIPSLNSVDIDLPVLGFTALLSLFTGVFFGVAPALHATHTDLIESLKEGGRTSSAGAARNRLRSSLVVSEVALALVLLASSGLLVRTLLRLREVNPGFNPANLLTMNVHLSTAKYPDGPHQVAFYNQMIDRIQALPGVKSAGVVQVLPMGGNFDGRGIQIADRPVLPGQEFSTPTYIATPGYLRTLEILLRQGRLFTEHDDATGEKVVLVNKAFARQIWPGENPLGKQIRFPGRGGWENQPWRTVVGVVGDVKQSRLDGPDETQLYVPEAQFPVSWMTLVVRTEQRPESLLSAVRAQIHSLDPDQAVFQVATMDQLLADSIALRRFVMLLLASFAAVALLLAAVGIYGVIAYSVSQRTHEIGVRMALGAQARDVLGLVMGQGLILVAVGLVLGAVAGMVMTRLLDSLLFGVGAGDAVTFASVALLLAIIAMLACYIPARRAMRVDPMVALRYE